MSATSLMVLAAVAVAVALIYTRAVMIPFVLAIFISYLVSPLVDFLQLRLRAPRWTSIVAALFVVVGLMTLLGLLITVSTRGLIESAPIYRERLAHLAQTGFSLLGRYNIDLGQQTVLEAVRQLPILSFLRGTAGTVLGLLSNGFLVLIFVIYLLAGRNPNELRQGMYAQIDKLIRHYIVTKVTTSAATGILVGVALALFGLDLALVFGVLAFLLNFIPNVGSVAATLLPVPLALVQFDSWWAIGGVIIVPAIIQNVIGNGIEPRMMGEGLELHPVTILLALVFWGLLWGAVGMLLAAPMTAVLRIVLGEFETTRPLAELLAGRLPPVVPSPEASRE